MSDRISELASRIEAVENRLAALENVFQTTQVREEPEFGPSLGEGFVGNTATNLGRTLLIFGGAYLLRAITDAQLVPTGLGISFGAAYALLWLYLSYRASATDGGRTAAAFYGVTSILLALPLAAEAATRFGLLSGAQGAVALTIFCGLALALAALRRLRSVAWTVTGGGIAVGLMLVNAARAPISIAAFLLLLGLGSLWVSYRREWFVPRWLGALGANAGVLVVILLSGSEQWVVRPIVAFALCVPLVIAYAISFAVRTHLHDRSVGPFETIQTLMMLAILLGAAFTASRAQELELFMVGALLLLLGGAGYALAFFPKAQADRRGNQFFYATFGVILVVVGSALMVDPALAAFLWSLMAIAMAWTSGRTGRVILSLQCTFLLLAAGFSSGILAAGTHALAGDAAESWPTGSVWQLTVAAATVACLFIPVPHSSERWGRLAGLPQLIVLALSVWGVGGLMVAYSAPWLTDAPGTDVQLGVLAAVRTAVLSAASVTLALSSLHRRWPEARWLAYPVLVLIGLKLLLEDIPHGQPATLFVSFAFVGSAMILVSKLMGLRKQKQLDSVDADQPNAE